MLFEKTYDVAYTKNVTTEKFYVYIRYREYILDIIYEKFNFESDLIGHGNRLTYLEHILPKDTKTIELMSNIDEFFANCLLDVDDLEKVTKYANRMINLYFII